MLSKDDSSGVTSAPASPGHMLRAAREAKGVHLAVLSVALKVPTRQLEALENDQHDAFKGTIFVRALAQAVCRQLGVDPAPVLAALPKTLSPLSVPSSPSTPVVSSLTSGAVRARKLGKGVSRWVLWLAALMLVGAAALIWWPQSPTEAPASSEPVSQAWPVVEPVEPASDAAPMPAPVASAPLVVAAPPVASAPQIAALPQASAPAVAAKPLVPVTPSVAPSVVPSVAPQAQASASINSAPLLLRASADTWITVRDSRGQLVLNRQVKSGESIKLDMAPPFFVYAGRSDGLELQWRGQSVDLKPHSQNNEIRLFIKP